MIARALSTALLGFMLILLAQSDDGDCNCDQWNTSLNDTNNATLGFILEVPYYDDESKWCNCTITVCSIVKKFLICVVQVTRQASGLLYFALYDAHYRPYFVEVSDGNLGPF